MIKTHKLIIKDQAFAEALKRNYEQGKGSPKDTLDLIKQFAKPGESISDTADRIFDIEFD